MTHVSLYRKYRPQTFEDVVGQAHVTRTLRNAVREGTVAHAYLFTGPRGTGKTTTARILAKALLCERGPTPEPDDTCRNCRDVAEGRHPDVHELDAASRTQVENVREEIIGRVAYAPTRGAWKVYIIDEVHMLSMHSFNALLKTIEEPPSKTVFVLCTTHPNKVPETIHSRCQRFDFHRIGVDDIAGRLAYVAEREGIDAEEGALPLMARHAAGSMRDALGSLEQLASFTGGHVTLADVESLLGEVDVALLFEMSALIAERDVAGAFGLVARLAEGGTDLVEYARELSGHFRDLYVAAVVGDPSGVVDVTAEEMAGLMTRARAFGPDRLARCLDLLGQLAAELRSTSDARLALEVALTRMARPEGDLTLESLAERVAVLEAGGQAAPAAGPCRSPAGPTAERGADAPAEPVPARDTGSAAPEAAGGRPDAAGPPDRAAVKRAWPSVLGEMRRARRSRATLFANTEADLDADGETLVVEFPADNDFNMRMAGEPDTHKLLKAALASVLGTAPPFRYQLGRGPVRPAEPAPAARTATSATAGRDEGAAAGRDEGPDVPQAGPEGARGGDLERQVIDDLGAEVVGEHPLEGSEEA
ncbi:MAG: DNA polymerase III subunit gamma/tau [Coriobacteriia bacterium]|nr:DNA polymerase III subunit gamma/tau [Coriobacteriia bacterium]